MFQGQIKHQITYKAQCILIKHDKIKISFLSTMLKTDPKSTWLERQAVLKEPQRTTETKHNFHVRQDKNIKGCS